MDLDSIRLFVKIVELGSLAKAARQLQYPATTVSAKLASLERALKTTLIQRTTRRIYVTPAGKVYYQRCVRALLELSEGEAEIESAAVEPTGVLRITSTLEMVGPLLSPVIASFLEQYSKVDIDLIVTNRLVDLVGEGVDVAIRTGAITDVHLVAIPLLTIKTGMFASPHYLEKWGHLNAPQDIAQHRLIVFKRFLGRTLIMLNQRVRASVEFNSRLIADDMLALKDMGEHGLGLAILPEFIAQESVALGRLVRVLPEWQFEGKGQLSLVYPRQRYISPRLKIFIQRLQAVCQSM